MGQFVKVRENVGLTNIKEMNRTYENFTYLWVGAEIYRIFLLLNYTNIIVIQCYALVYVLENLVKVHCCGTPLLTFKY